MTTTITSITNLNYIPNINSNSNYPSDQINNIIFTTIGATSQQIIGSASIYPSQFVTNDAYDTYNCTSTRNNTLSGAYTNITVNYLTQLGTSQNIMQITLPQGQSTFTTGLSNCFIGSSQQLCNILSSNSSDIFISLIPNATVLLTSILNSYPNNNNIRVRIFTTAQQLIEEGSSPILPAISLWKINMTGSATSSKVGDISYLFFQVTPTQLRINSSNILKILLPSKMFTRVFNNDDCFVRPPSSSTVYTGCTYEFDSAGWLKTITLGFIGTYGIDINTTLTINVSVTNSWASYPFGNNSFIINVYLDSTTYVSQGMTSFIDLYQGLTTFIPIEISMASSSFSQSQLQAGSGNILATVVSFTGNVGNGTKISVQLPKDSFIFSTLANSNVVLSSEDPYYYYILIPTTCNAFGCINFNQQFNLIAINNFYVKKQTNNIIIFAQYDGLAASQSYIVAPTSHIPLSLPALDLRRNTSIGANYVSISIKFNLIS